MSETVDVTEYLYQKLSLYIAFQDTDFKQLETFSDFFLDSTFFPTFEHMIAALIQVRALSPKEIDNLFRFFQFARTLDIGNEAFHIINSGIRALNQYSSIMQGTYDKTYYGIELVKRFSDKEKNIADIKASLALDFTILWAFLFDDTKLFEGEILPNMDMNYPFIANIRAFYKEKPELFQKEVFVVRLAQLIVYWQEELKRTKMPIVDRLKSRQKIKQYEQFLPRSE